jgi:hypothetical protein
MWGGNYSGLGSGWANVIISEDSTFEFRFVIINNYFFETYPESDTKEFRELIFKGTWSFHQYYKIAKSNYQTQFEMHRSITGFITFYITDSPIGLVHDIYSSGIYHIYCDGGDLDIRIADGYHHHDIDIKFSY